jgi:gas vesicle protein
MLLIGGILGGIVTSFIALVVATAKYDLARH